MKKSILIVFLIIIFFVIDASISYAKKNNIVQVNDDNEIRAIYISYLEYLKYFSGNSKTINQIKIDKMVDRIREKNINLILLHVSPFSDSIYDSKLFPYSYTLTGVEGKNPGFDYLSYFLKSAHAKNIKVHAWINPYRISFDNNTNNLSDKNPAKRLLNTSSIKIDEKGIYYNPASSVVKNLIIRQVEEIIDKYNVDGIHFDDYFYIQDDIDKLEYTNYLNNGGELSIKEFRLNNTNDLIMQVYKTIKNKNKDLIFSIAPDGNINNNYLYHYADVKTWLSNDGYIDMIMPQLYYGFKNEYSPFDKTLSNWIELCINKDIKIVPVLALYKVGEIDNGAGTGRNEWIEDNNIISKEISVIENNKLAGYAFFRYDYFVK